MHRAPAFATGRHVSTTSRVLALVAALGVAAFVGACSDSGSNGDPDVGPNGAAAIEPSAPSSAGPMSLAPASGGEDAVPEIAGEPESEPPPVAGTDSARYRVVFDATWSPATHPEGFPGNPHFSGLVGAVHNEQVRFWEPGQIASDGIASVAETGGKDPFRDELGAAIDDGRALALIDGPGVPASPGRAAVEIDVTRDYPELTLVTMLAPSPDWFVGVHGLSLLEDGDFVGGRTVELLLYDAGTDTGLGYTSANLPADSRSPIGTLTSAPGDSPFVDGGPSVGTLRVERIATP